MSHALDEVHSTLLYGSDYEPRSALTFDGDGDRDGDGDGDGDGSGDGDGMGMGDSDGDGDGIEKKCQ